jgi:hypothetical protein
MRRFAGLLVAGWFALSIAACSDNVSGFVGSGLPSGRTIDSIVHHVRDTLNHIRDSSRHDGRDSTGRGDRDSTETRDTTEIRHGLDDTTHIEHDGETDTTHHGGHDGSGHH